MLMPFGKNKGKDLEDLSSSYLRWVAENVDTNDELVEAAEDELRYRDDHRCHKEDQMKVECEVCRNWFVRGIKFFYGLNACKKCRCGIEENGFKTWEKMISERND